MLRQPEPISAVLLTARDCALCEHAKEVLERVSADHPLTLSTLALDCPAGRRLAAEHGVLFAPGLLLDGKVFSYGRVSERKLRRVLSRLGGAAPSV